MSRRRRKDYPRRDYPGWPRQRPMPPHVKRAHELSREAERDAEPVGMLAMGRGIQTRDRKEDRR